MVAGGTSEITFKLRYGASAGPATLNSNDGTARKYGGKTITSIKVTEIKAS
jgi:hypothetical protein